MAENLAHRLVQTRFRPVGMLAALSCRLHFSRGPVKPLRQMQPPQTVHRAQCGNLFVTCLLIRQHETIMRQNEISCNPLDSTFLGCPVCIIARGLVERRAFANRTVNQVAIRRGAQGENIRLRREAECGEKHPSHSQCQIATLDGMSVRAGLRSRAQ